MRKIKCTKERKEKGKVKSAREREKRNRKLKKELL